MTFPLPADTKAKIVNIIDEYTSGTSGRKIPGLIYTAFRRDGQILFRHSSGTKGIRSEEPLSTDSIFWLASFTKLATSVACMQLVEQEVLRLDDADQIESICPELRDVRVLARTAAGTFELVEKKRRITLRMLLNHTAGFGYAFEDDNLAEYTRPIGSDDFSGIGVEKLNRPLVNQPGEKFQYGTSMDWVGVIIERISGTSLETYFKTRIFEPLEMKSVSFHPSAKARSDLAFMHRRLPDGKLIHTDHLYRRPLLEDNIPCAGGHGCFGKPAEFARLVSLLLNDGTDQVSGATLLQPETVQEMFKDQIPDKPRFSNICVPVAKPELANPTPLSPMPEDHTEGWGLSFSIGHFAEATGRSAGAGSWEGLPNLFWFADRKNNVGGIIASQILPYGDAYVRECSDRVETEIYKALSTQGRGLVAEEK